MDPHFSCSNYAFKSRTLFYKNLEQATILSFKKTVNDTTPFLALSVLKTVGDAMNSTHAWDAN